MADILSMIDRLIAEHKAISEKAKSMENIINDTGLISEIGQAADTVVPGKTDQVERLQFLEKSLQSIAAMVEKHFKYEETVLLKAMENYGDADLVKSLNHLLAEHSDLRERLDRSKKRIADLSVDNLHRAAFDITELETITSLNYTRSVFQKHATRENKLFSQIRRKIMLVQA